MTERQERIPIKSLAGAIASITIVGVAFGHSIPLLSLLLESYGASDAVIGTNTAFGAMATLAGAPFYPSLIGKMGLRGFLLSCIALMVVPYVLIHIAGDRIALWYPLRFFLSFGAGGLFAGSEIWVNGLAPDHMRGKIVGIYATCLALGFALGPLLLELSGYRGIAPFLLGSAVFASAAIPLLFVRAPQTQQGEHDTSIFPPLRQAPGLFSAPAIFAGVESAMLIFLPILALELGHSAELGARMLTVYGLGLVTAQFPVGQLCDRFSARSVLMGCALAGAGLALLLPLSQGLMVVFLAVLFMWGGAVGGLYTAGLVHLGNRYQGPELAAANTAFVFAYAAGAVIGPFAAGLIRSGLGSDGMIIMTALALTLYALAVRRMPRRAG